MSENETNNPARVPARRRARRAAGGYTLLEGMVASLVTLLVLGVAAQTVMVATRVSNSVVQNNETQQAARGQLDILTQDIQQADLALPEYTAPGAGGAGGTRYEASRNDTLILRLPSITRRNGADHDEVVPNKFDHVIYRVSVPAGVNSPDGPYILRRIVVPDAASSRPAVRANDAAAVVARNIDDNMFALAANGEPVRNGQGQQVRVPRFNYIATQSLATSACTPTGLTSCRFENLRAVYAPDPAAGVAVADAVVFPASATGVAGGGVSLTVPTGATERDLVDQSEATFSATAKQLTLSPRPPAIPLLGVSLPGYYSAVDVRYSVDPNPEEIETGETGAAKPTAYLPGDGGNGATQIRVQFTFKPVARQGSGASGANPTANVITATAVLRNRPQ